MPYARPKTSKREETWPGQWQSGRAGTLSGSAAKSHVEKDRRSVLGKIQDGERRERNGGEKLLREMNRFSFVVSAARYDRDGNDLESRGLYLDVGPWGFHPFKLL